MQVERSAGSGGTGGVRVEEDVNPLKKSGGVRGEAAAAAGGGSGGSDSGGATPLAAQLTAPGHLAHERPPPSASLLANKYLILDPPEGCSLHTCIDVNTQQEFVCRVVGRDSWTIISAHYRLDQHPHINSVREVLMGDEYMYLVFPASFGDLHSHVRQRKRLRESEARRLFRQMAETVRACHRQGVVLRDLKLRKFVFSNSSRSVPKFI
ncbi:hypothetical protein AAG570_001262 [Ranatra chinensis]|uniref:Protein kinase domain-containing protein n=1 Tax=Ranatra chinensis TaxID=642074 RepID=A0ABD0YBC4_9HEMI